MDLFADPFAQRALVEVLLLSPGAGVLGTFVVLRSLAFYSHAIGSATFPGLVLADGVGFAAGLGAAVAAAVFAAALVPRWLADAHRDTRVGLVLTGALALGVVLASDVFASGVNVERLLFGSLLAVGDGDLVAAAAATALVLLSAWLFGRHWVAVGFAAAPPEGRRRGPDVALLALVAMMTLAMLSALGALLTTSLLIVPAAAARLWTDRLASWQAASVALVAISAVGGLVVSLALNAPAGPAIASVAAGAFALAALARLFADRRGRRSVAWGATCLLTVGLSGCANEPARESRQPQVPESREPQVRVVATTPVVGDLVREVAGDAVQLRVLLRPNSDPHGYEPRPADIRDTSRAQLVVRSGGELDDWMPAVIERSGTTARAITLIDRLPFPLRGKAHQDEHEEDHAADADREESGHAQEREDQAAKIDPHWWHDPRNAEAAAKRIRDGLTRLRPGQRATFASYAADFTQRLRALDSTIARCLIRVPEQNRKLVTDHDAFSYFARRYDIEVIGAVIPARTTQAQPSAGDTRRLIEAIRRERVGAIFAEESVNPRVAEAIARETGASTEYKLYGDTLGPPGSRGDTYLRMLEANANEMTRGFTGGVARCTSAR